jgi:hypothetical protein
MTDLRIRTMRPEEISIAVGWAAAEGWNPGHADAVCFVAADPEGFFIGELDGAPAATISCVNYGDSFAFLGFYIVRKDLRGRGYGLSIWNAAIEHAGARVIGLTTMPSPSQACSSSVQLGPAANMIPSLSSFSWKGRCAARFSMTGPMSLAGLVNTT